ASAGQFGPSLTGPAVAFEFVYLLEILLLFATLAIVSPLIKHWRRSSATAVSSQSIGLDQMPG
ncbi:MAG: MFS transporter, partial [Pseudomonadota bacterium]